MLFGFTSFHQVILFYFPKLFNSIEFLMEFFTFLMVSELMIELQ